MDGLTGLLDAAGRLLAGGRSHIGPPGTNGAQPALVAGSFGTGFQPAVLVRESNPRQPDSRSGALSTELTSHDTTFGQNP